MLVVPLLASIILQEPSLTVDRDCLDDNHTNRCDAEIQARSRARLGVVSIEDEAATGTELYRAFYIDGYGREMPAVSFERRPGQPPMVVVYEDKGRRLTAPVSSDIWEEVSARAVFADRPLGEAERPLPGVDRDMIGERICLHSWVSTVEMANSSDYGFDLIPVRRRTEDSCHRGLATQYAFLLARLAVEAIAPCEALAVTGNRNDVTLLASCFRLEGDTLAAADLLTAKHLNVWPDQPVEWDIWLGSQTNTRLDWAGEIIEDTNVFRMDEPPPPTVADFLAGQTTSDDLYLSANRIAARTSTQAQILGEVIAHRRKQDGGPSMIADYTQSWVRSGGEWSLQSWTVGPFRPLD